ncbi:MAG: hypothetical protein QOK43_1228 [Acidimicrobiaceae bacterium]|jgi:hypothetical protein|nr:hypothetical protein [Acidimicrobiaceae bacterium]MDQ1444776.1 hypothetical protein [Acidimicrobiaceae bacterium]
MPLSEDEQRILHEIERSFYENDPAFARGVKDSPTVYRHAGRNMKWAGLGLVVGLIVVVVFLSSLLLALAGFAIMLVSALAFERNLRRMGRAGLQQLSESVRSRGFPDVFGDTRKRLRERFKRTDD